MPYELGKTSPKFRASIRTNHNHRFNTVVIIAIIIITITIIVCFFSLFIKRNFEIYIRGNSSYIIRLNSVSIRSEIGRRSLTTFYKNTLT